MASGRRATTVRRYDGRDSSPPSNDTHGGGVYEWESLEAARALYDETWFERLRTVYGAQPELQFFDLHAMVDNDAHVARIDA